MTKRYIILAIIMASFLFFYLNTPDEKITEVCIKDRCFNVEIADSHTERTKGLMFREELAEESGMLFIFDRSDIHSFWMKNTYISLDIIWIDDNHEVVWIAENVLPCSSDPCPVIEPQVSSNFVLELNALFVLQLEIHSY